MLRQFFERFDLFTPQEIDSILGLFSKHTLNKNHFLIQEGEKCEAIAFIESGVFRSFYTTETGNEITYCFRFPDNLIGAYSAFITGGSSIESIQALLETTIWSIQKKELDQLADVFPKWNTFLKIIAEQQYLELEQRVIQFQRETAQERYRNLLVNYPNFIQYIPLQYVASYLGITQRHLSRIRKEIIF
ncbi:Crp/Fnr family transcriptional regulator [Myroides odoratus]|uniref:Crp/Fnr family transcriptional regulator n=1 Tax=Myroides odoratus TaxID=256 RepID=UPI0039AFEB16